MNQQAISSVDDERISPVVGSHGTVRRAERRGHPPCLSVLLVLPNGLDPLAGVQLEALELDPLTLRGTLHAGLPQVLDDHRLELGATHILLAVTLGLRAL